MQKTNKPSSQKTLGFINVNSVDGLISEEGRRVVRSHAAVRGWVALCNEPHPRRVRKRRSNFSKVLQAQQTLLDLEQARDSSSPEGWSEDERLDALRARVGDCEILTHQVDPFDTLPIPNNPFINMLLHNFFKRWIVEAPELQAPATPNAYTAKFWPMIQCSPIALATHLLLSAGVLFLITGVSLESPSILQLKSRALRLLNQAVATESCSDIIILAVMSLANYEYLTGCHQEVLAHMNGLQRMVALRGGIDQLAPYTQRILIFSDKSIAFTAQVPRKFPQVTEDDLYRRIMVPEPDPSITLHRGFKPLVESGVIHAHLVPRLLQLQWVFTRLRTAYPSPQWAAVVSRDEWIVTESKLDVVTLASFVAQMNNYKLTHAAPNPFDIGDCVRLGALILCYHLRHLCIPDASTREPLVSQIKKTLLEHVHEHLLVSKSHLVVPKEEIKALWWVFCMVRCFAPSRDERLHDILTTLKAKLHMKSPKNSINVLESFLFCHSMFEDEHTRLWAWVKESRSIASTSTEIPGGSLTDRSREPLQHLDSNETEISSEVLFDPWE